MKIKLINLSEIKEYCCSLGIDIGFSDDIKVFRKKKQIGSKMLQNSVAILPMEGCDAIKNGSPSDLTLRRYLRFAKSGAALIWFEATAIAEDGKASPHQLAINDKTLDSFKLILEQTKEKCLRENGFEPAIVLQLTHSGRYSKPNGFPAPVRAAENPKLDEKYNISASVPLVSDERLRHLEDEYVRAALLSQQAGFDGVDIKASHGYLISELLSAYTRKGIYGGDFDGRTRLLRNVVTKCADVLGGKDCFIATRFSMYDAMDYPYGFGVAKEDGSPDLREPEKLLGILKAAGLVSAAVSAGNPYFNPHYNRPFDIGEYEPPEEPLKGVERLISLAGKLKARVPGVIFIGTGYTYLGKFSAQAGAYALENGMIDVVGLGRQAIAAPDAIADLVTGRPINSERLCVLCSKCSEIMRAGGTTGCVVRDSEIFVPIYNKYCGAFK